MCDSQSSETFVNLQHFGDGFNRMYELMKESKFCDVEIKFNNEKHLVHSVVVVGFSEYLRSKLDGNNPHLKEITLENVDSYAVTKLLEFCYTGFIEINENNVDGILSAAHFLQIENVCQNCCKFLKRTINQTNYCKRLDLGKNYCYELYEVALIYARYDYDELIKSGEFLKLSKEIIVDLLKSSLNVSSETENFAAIKKWVNYDRQKRIQVIHEILEFIKLPHLPSEVLLADVKQLCNLEPRCEHLLTEALQWKLLPNKQNSLKSFRTEPRLPAMTILTMGAYDINKSSYVEVYNPLTKVWVELFDLKFKRRHYRAELFNDKIMIIGGFVQDTITDMVENLNLETGERTLMKPLNKPRGYPAVVVLDDHVYVAGGFDQQGPTTTVERWDRNPGVWTVVESMSVARDGCRAAVLNDEMYVIGGFNQTALSVVEAYNPITGKWRGCASMQIKRMYPGVAAVGGYLYVIGGRERNHHVTEKYSSVERYDPSNNKWTFVADISSPRYGISGGVLDEKVVSVCGSNGSQILTIVEEYDTVKNTWTDLASTKYPRESPAVISVPWRLVKNKLSCG